MTCPIRPQRRPYLQLLAAPFCLSLIDVFVTLYYQPAEYWRGERSALVEANPLVWVALRIHPILMLPGVVGWYGIAVVLMFRTPAWFGLRVYFVLVAGHLIGIAGWLLRHHPHGWLLTGVTWVLGAGAAVLLFLPFREQWNAKRPIERDR